MKMYMPSSLINSNYIYEVYDNYYQVKTNNGCYASYNTTYCNCYRVYFKNNYLTTAPYSCNISSNIYQLVDVQWTNSYFYRYDITNIMILIFIFMFVFWYVLKVILKGVGLNA